MTEGAFPAYGSRAEPADRPGSPRAPLRHQALRDRLDCRFEAVDGVFDDCLDDAQARLSPAGLQAYIDHARLLGKLGRGVEPVLAFLEVWPTVATLAGEASLEPLVQATRALQASPNGRAIAPLIQHLGAVARRLRSPELMARYLALVVELMQRTSVSIHGHHVTEPSPCLPTFLQHAPQLLGLVPLEGLRRWLSEGVRLHAAHPQRLIDYIAQQLPDSRALLQRERHGTLLVDVERRLELTLRALWNEPVALMPFAVRASDDLADRQAELPRAVPEGFQLPEVLDNRPGATAVQRYRAMLAHLAGHRRWSRPLVADNWSPLQRLAVECFEDARIDHLVLRRFPGLRRVLLALHPVPLAGACDPERQSCLRHRLTCLSRALLDADHPYRDAVLLGFRERFLGLLAGGESSTAEMARLALDWATRTRRQSDQLASMQFDQTWVD